MTHPIFDINEMVSKNPSYMECFPENALNLIKNDVKFIEPEKYLSSENNK